MVPLRQTFTLTSSHKQPLSLPESIPHSELQVYVFTTAAFSHSPHMMQFRGGSGFRTAPPQPPNLFPLQRQSHMQGYITGESPLHTEPGCQLTRLSSGESNATCTHTHAQHKVTIFCFNEVHVPIERTFYSIFPFVRCKRCTCSSLHAYIKHTLTHRVLEDSRSKAHCAYLSYFSHDLAHCPRFQSLLHTAHPREGTVPPNRQNALFYFPSIISCILKPFTSQYHECL